MRFIRPNSAASGSGPPIGAGHSRPSWLIEWRKNLPKFVQLTKCGCKTDASIPNTILAKFPEGVELLCENHWAFSPMRSIGLQEYLGIAAAPIPDDPMF